MGNKTLLIEQALAYLPFKAKLQVIEKKPYYGAEDLIRIEEYKINDPLQPFQKRYKIKGCKLILRPLSDYKDVNGEAMIDLNCDISDQITISEAANKKIVTLAMSYDVIEILLRNHVDVFDLIPNNLAVDINTIDR